MEFIYSNVVAIGVSVAIIAGLGIWLFKLNKSKGDMELEEVIATFAVDRNELIFILSIAIIFLAGAGVAATVHNPNELPVNPFMRLLSHVAISVVGTVASVTAVRDVSSCFIKEMSKVDRLFTILTTIVVIFVAVSVPIFNLYLICAGLGKDWEFEILAYAWNPFTSNDEFRSFLISNGLPVNYRPMGALPTIGKVEVIMTLIHYCLCCIEGGRNLASPTRRQMLFARVRKQYEKANKKDLGTTKTPMPAQQRQQKQIPDNLKFLLSRVGYSGQKLDGMVIKAATAVDKITETQERLTLTATIGMLVSSCKTYDQSPNKNAAEGAKLMDKIYELFETKSDPTDSAGKPIPIEKRGLGIPLKARAKT